MIFFHILWFFQFPYSAYSSFAWKLDLLNLINNQWCCTKSFSISSMALLFLLTSLINASDSETKGRR